MSDSAIIPQVKWGLVGAGDVCERKSGGPLYQLPGHSLVAITRRDPLKGRDFARRHGPSLYVPTLADLLAHPEINAVYVATPAHVHADQAIAAAEAGKHVLVEKPMAMSTAECNRMIDACHANGVLLAVAYYRRAYPSVLRAKALLEANRIGPLRKIWFNDQFPPSHRLDLAHFFGGDLDTARVEAVPGGAVLIARFHSGAVLRMNLGWTEHPGAPEQFRLVGEEGEIFVEDLKGGSITGVVQERFPPEPWTHRGIIENFGMALAGRAPLSCPGVEGRKSTVVLDAVSCLEPDGPETRLQYDAPPEPDLERAAQYHLLG